MKQMQRLLREPLLHFLALGGLIFALFAAVSDPTPTPVNTIVIGPARIEQLSKGFQAAWRRPPSNDELSGIIDDAVREEVYYREALALGLDTNDTIVRRRLRQKMEFLTDSGAALLEPVAGELEAHLLANEEAFQQDPSLTFEQVYLGENPSHESTQRLLSDLQVHSTADPSTLGQRSLLPTELSLSSPATVDGIFGEGFFARLAELPLGLWAGPVDSGFGVHLVRIAEMQAARTPTLEEVREAVLRDWKATKAGELRELHYARLRERYVVEIRHAEPASAKNQ